ncbi:MAG: hypothetical protein U0791_27415 [Gemmataceae bacterium]
MPMHDWTRVDPREYFSFHLSWLASIAGSLNREGLPDTHYAMSDHATSPVPRFRLAVKKASDGQIVSIIEIVSPSDKAKLRDFSLLVEDLIRLLRLGIHLVVVDPFPSRGVHSRLWREFTGTESGSTPEKAASFMSYQVGGREPHAYVDEAAFGSDLPEMPLFLSEDKCVSLPLEESYRTAWDGYPLPIRKLLESR